MNEPHFSPEDEAMRLQQKLADLKRGIAFDYDSMKARLREGFGILFQLLNMNGKKSITLDPPHDVYDIWNRCALNVSEVLFKQVFEPDTNETEESILVVGGEIQYDIEEITLSDRMELLFVLHEELDEMIGD